MRRPGAQDNSRKGNAMTPAADRAGPIKAERPHELRLTFLASCEDIRHALSDLRTFLRDAGIDADERGTVEIVLAEVLNNVAEHAYAMREPGKVWLDVTLEEESLIADITDAGVPLPGLCLPAGRNPAPDAAISSLSRHDLPEGGFGWFLIRSLTSTLRYRRVAGRNHLHLAMDLAASDASD